MNFKNAIYYPSIEFQDSNWLKGMALYYDRIYRIVPETREPRDSDEIRALIESGKIGSCIDPQKYAKAASSKFLSKIQSSDWNAAALSTEDQAIDDLLHVTKTDASVRKLFEKLGYKADENWISVPTELASNYMLYLATEVAQANKLSLLTDNFVPWSATTYFNLNGKFDDFGNRSFGQLREGGAGYLFSLVFQGLTPINISEISSSKIVEFREKRADEITNLRSTLESVHNEIISIQEDTIVKDRIDDLIKEAERAVTDYQKSADIIQAKGWFGIQFMGIPASAQLARLFGLSTEQEMMMIGTGIALGTLYSLTAKQKELKTLARSNPYSVIAMLQKELKPAQNRFDISYQAYRHLEEYIND